jgi:P27 family predicted phage terminase small subunit
MARGRKPKPVELAQVDGNPGRRPLPEPLRPEKGLDFTPPGMLGRDGAELWVEMTSQLGAIGALYAVDRAGLLALCLQWDRAMAAADVLEEQGHYARGSLGQVVEHPALKVEARAHAAILKFAAEYAATPVARARVATAAAARRQQDEFEEITAGEASEIDVAAEIDDDEL